MKERRVHKRYQRKFSVNLRGQDYEGYDISSGGLSFSSLHSSTKLRLGQRFPNVIVTQDNDQHYEIAAVEICSVRDANGYGFYGARIVHLTEHAKFYHGQLTLGQKLADAVDFAPEAPNPRTMKERITSAKAIFSDDDTPSLPDHIHTMHAELGHKYANTANIAFLVNQQPEMLAEFIKTVKQTLPADKQQSIHNATSAIQAVGLDNVYNFLLSSCLSRCIAEDEFEIDLLQHALRVGIAASEIALWVFDIDQSEAYLAGILQNIGAVYLARKLQQVKYQTILMDQRFHPWSAYQHELENYDTTHVYVGAVIMKNWGVDENIIKATLLHHNDLILNNPSSTPIIDTISATLMLANYAVGAAYGKDKITEELLEYKNQAITFLKLPENVVESAIAKILRINPPPDESEEDGSQSSVPPQASNNLNTIFEGI